MRARGARAESEATGAAITAGTCRQGRTDATVTADNILNHLFPAVMLEIQQVGYSGGSLRSRGQEAFRTADWISRRVSVKCPTRNTRPSWREPALTEKYAAHGQSGNVMHGRVPSLLKVISSSSLSICNRNLCRDPGRPQAPANPCSANSRPA